MEYLYIWIFSWYIYYMVHISNNENYMSLINVIGAKWKGKGKHKFYYINLKKKAGKADILILALLKTMKNGAS